MNVDRTADPVRIKHEPLQVTLPGSIKFETYEGGEGTEWFIRVRDGRRQVCLNAYEAGQLALFIKVVLHDH